MKAGIIMHVPDYQWKIVVKYLIGAKPRYKKIIKFREGFIVKMSKADAILLLQFLCDSIEKAYNKKEFSEAVQLNGIAEIVNYYLREYLDGYTKN